MAVDGSLIFDTEIDTSGVEKGVGNIRTTMQTAGTVVVNLERQFENVGDTASQAANHMEDLLDVIRSIDRSTSNVSEQMDALAESTERTRENTKGFGDLLGANILGNLATEAMQTAGTKLASLAKEGRDLASDLQEVQNVVDTTFGDGAGQIYTWADAAKESFGMSSLQAQNFNGTLGAMLKSMGLADDAVMQMSTDMVGLAGDMASFYNLDVEQAFDKIRAGISGETEPLKQLGINMSVANLEAYALSQGIEKAYSAMTQAEQAQLRYNYLMSATADAQGDFAKTSDSFANQQRILELNMQNLSATLGEQLLPALNETMGLLIDELPKAVPVVEEIGETAAGAIEFVLDNGDAVIATIAAVAGGVVTFEVATKGAATAQAAFNAVANLNPYVLLASAAVAATAGITAYAAASSAAIDDVNKKVEELRKNTENTIADTDVEIAVIKDKSREYEELRSKIERTAGEEERLKMLAEELQVYMPEGTSLIDEQTGAYNSLADSIDKVVEKMKAQAVFDAYKEEYTELIKARKDAVNNLWDTNNQLESSAIENAFAYSPLGAVINFGNDIIDAGTSNKAVESLNEIDGQILQLEADMERAAETLASLGGSTEKTVGVANFVNPQQMFAENQIENYMNEAIKARETATEKLQEKWEELEHEYASSTTMTEEELYAKKREIWNKYGDESYKDHWDYYEDLIQHDKDFAAEQARLAEENAAKEKAELEKRYDEQFDIVDDGLNDIISAHKEAYSELERQREAYRNKLMAIGGDLFSVDVSEGENGEKITTYTVNNLDEQLRKMKEYHRQISSLKKQGASAGLLEELTSLGDEESAQFAKYLSGMSATEFAKINDLYNEKQKLADELAGDLYKSEAQAISDSMTSALSDLATSAYSYGASAAEQFSAGFSAAANELGIGALYNQIQAAGATRSYENYVTVAPDSNAKLNVDFDFTGKTILNLDGRVIGEALTEYREQKNHQIGG